MLAKDNRLAARMALKNHWGISLLVTLVAGLLGGSVSGGGSGGSMMSTTVQNVAPSTNGYEAIAPEILYPLMGFLASVALVTVLYSIAVFIIGGAINLGQKQYYISLIKQDRPAEFSTLFSKFDRFGKALGLHVVTSIFVFLWSLLLVIPGIVAAYKYSMAPYIMAENPDVGIMEAIRQSREMMRGQKWNLFKLHLSFIGWILLSMLTFGIGLLWLNPYMSAAEANFYLTIPSNPQSFYYQPPNPDI